VYEPLHSDVYKFLSRLSQKGIIEFNDQIKPVTKGYIAEKLLEVKWKMEDRKWKSDDITNIEKEELEFYLKDYNLENSVKHHSLTTDSSTSATQKHRVNILNSNSGRLRLFNYSDSLFKINISPILGYEFGSINNKSYSHRWNGIYFYGYLTDYIDFSFDFRDNSETGDNIDRTKSFTPVTGITIAGSAGNNIQYSEIKTTISTSWNWGDFTIGKDFLEWGYGESGKLVLSQKAPSFPFIRLDLKPVEWLRFNYIHAWLASDVVDSSAIYTSLQRGVGNNRIQYREKFLASHTFTITPYKGLDFSFGESIIYSDKLEVSYLIPLMFFRLADHYLSRANNNAGGNSQFFVGVSSRNHIKNTHLYGTLFIDEISTEAFGNSNEERNQFGFTLGGSMVDLPINNISVTVEYTKIYPFVYKHYIPTQTYASASYILGHWMGHNADLIYASLNYRILRGFQATCWGQYIRKGGEGKPEDQFTQPQPPFLFGLNSRYTYLGFELKYEIMYDLFARGRFVYNQIEMEQIDGSYLKTNTKELYFSLYYGL
jgi:hypothetical protein